LYLTDAKSQITTPWQFGHGEQKLYLTDAKSQITTDVWS